MSSTMKNPKYLSRFWAALNSDFECLENLFLLVKGWQFRDFAECCKKLSITLIMHTTLGRGKGLDEHYSKTTNLILQTAKGFWLTPYDSKSDFDEQLAEKRRVGGFYLTYLMYSKQPYEGRVKIVLDIADLEILLEWRENIVITPLADEILLILHLLLKRDAFEYHLAVPPFGFQGETRNYLNNAKSEIISLTREMKNVQHEVAHKVVTPNSQPELVKYEKRKLAVVKRVWENVEQTEAEETKPKDTSEDFVVFEDDVYATNNLKTLMKMVGATEWSKAVEKLANQADKPVLTIQNLTASEAIDRRMMMETRKRIERNRKKTTSEGQQKSSRPYVNEGGIFGRKKEVDEGTPKEKRERGLCSSNLWTYIHGCEFGTLPDETAPRAEVKPSTSQE